MPGVKPRDTADVKGLVIFVGRTGTVNVGGIADTENFSSSPVVNTGLERTGTTPGSASEPVQTGKRKSAGGPVFRLSKDLDLLPVEPEVALTEEPVEDRSEDRCLIDL